MRGVLALAILAASAACGGDWQRLDGAALRAALSDRSLIYENGARQSFSADGATIYELGPAQIGRWRIEADRYCSVWPPSDLWSCYDVAQSANGKAVRFVAGDGSTTDGRYAAAP